MYLDNKYTVWYNNIITKAQHRVLVGYKEKHHIIPKSLGGDDTLFNLVELTAKEHFVCHMLLVRMTTGLSKKKMQLAMHKMCSFKPTQYRHKPTASQYEWIRKQCAEATSGENNPNYKTGLYCKKDAPRYPNHTYWFGKKRPYAKRTVTTFGNKNPNAKSVVTPNGIFSTVKEASESHNIGPNALRARIKKNSTEYYYLR